MEKERKRKSFSQTRQAHNTQSWYLWWRTTERERDKNRERDREESKKRERENERENRVAKHSLKLETANR